MTRRAVKVRIPADLAEALTAEAARIGEPFPWLVAGILRAHVLAGRDALPPLPAPDPVAEGRPPWRRRD